LPEAFFVQRINMKIEKVNLGKNYENAFNCKECPQSAEEDGCPAWWSYVVENIREGKLKEISGCGFALALDLLVSNSEASDRVTKTFDAVRGEMAAIPAVVFTMLGKVPSGKVIIRPALNDGEEEQRALSASSSSPVAGDDQGHTP